MNSQMKNPNLPFVHKAWPAIAAACLLLLHSAHFAHADTELGPHGEGLGDTADESNKFLGNTYKDATAGIQFAPPAGSTVNTGAGGALSFVNAEKKWGGELKTISLKEKQSVQEFMRDSVSSLIKSMKGVQVIETKEMKFEKYDAGRLVTSMEADVQAENAQQNGARSTNGPTEHIAAYRQQLIVRIADTQFMVLTLYTPLKDRADAERTFSAMVKSFQIYDKAELARQRALSIQAAKTWLAKQTADNLKTKLVNQPQLFRMKVAGRDVGYLRFDEREKEVDGINGILIIASTRAWPPDGTMVSGMNTAFWAYSHDAKGERQGYSTWDNATKTLAKGPNLPQGKYTFWVEESGQLIDQANTRLDQATLEQLQKERADMIREKALPPDQLPPQIERSQTTHHLIVTCTGDPTQSFSETSKGMDVIIPDFRPAFLPKVLEYTWPRLVDLTKPSEMTFVVYSSATRKLTFRTLSVKGPDRIDVDGKSTPCVKCTDEMDNAGTTVWVDSTGKILKMLTSDQSVLEPTTDDLMMRMWGEKIRAAGN